MHDHYFNIYFLSFTIQQRSKLFPGVRANYIVNAVKYFDLTLLAANIADCYPVILAIVICMNSSRCHCYKKI